MPAGARIDQLALPFVRLSGGGQCLSDVPPAAAAGVGQTLRQELFQSVLVQMASLRLVDRRLVRLQTASSQLLEDDQVRTVNAAWCVYVFNAYQPPAVVRSCIQPAGQRGNERAGMQRPGR